MPWKAWLVGHDFDLETLSELFGAGDPLVAHDQLNGYYVESLGIVVSGGQPDVSSAEALVKRVNGAARALDPAFQTVLATSLFEDLAAGLYEDASARLREHPALLRLLNLAPDPRAGGHLDLPAGDKELPETAQPITECDRRRSCAAPDPPIWRKIRSQ